jgi:hypothetical protein
VAPCATLPNLLSHDHCFLARTCTFRIERGSRFPWTYSFMSTWRLAAALLRLFTTTAWARTMDGSVWGPVCPSWRAAGGSARALLEPTHPLSSSLPLVRLPWPCQTIAPAEFLIVKLT